MLRKGIISLKIIFIIGVFIFNVFVQCQQDCWTSFNAKEHFNIMDELDARYENVRSNFQTIMGGRSFDKDMIVAMLKTRGIAERALHEAKGNESVIPAGINLGGYCMMKMPNTVLFFHRMKLRNDTKFRVKKLKNDFANLIMKIELILHDLHLFGSYDLTIASKPGYLAYEPTFGQVELLLQNVKYKVDGRYRFLKGKLSIEMIISELRIASDVLMMHRNHNSTSKIELHKKNINVFLERLQVDLDKWIKDYLNDYLMYYVAADDEEYSNYNREKIVILNNYTDNAINTVIERIHDTNADAVQLPAFTISVTNDKEVRLRDGVLRGLDSIYRRAIATGTKDRYMRKVDTVVGFSDLKVIYRYDAILKSGLPPVTGVLILAADELTARMGLILLKDSARADLSFNFLEQAKPESLTVEGPANRMISNFKYLLERHIIAIMSNTLLHNVKMLGTLGKCVPIREPRGSEKYQTPGKDAIDGQEETADMSNPSHDNYNESSEHDPSENREDNMLVNITSDFEEVLDKSNISRDSLSDSVPVLPSNEEFDEHSPNNEDNMMVGSNFFEAALERSNNSREKTLIGVHDVENENTLRNIKHYPRLPLREIPFKKNVKHLKKSIKRTYNNTRNYRTK